MGWSHSAGCRDSLFYPYRMSDKQTQDQKSGKPAWKTLGRFSKKKVVVNPTSTHHVRPRVSSHINDNYCVNAPIPRWLTRSKENLNFIVLIHPIQWTIANPVGTDRPAKHQKKTSCVSTGWPISVLCTRKLAHRTSFLS